MIAVFLVRLQKYLAKNIALPQKFFVSRSAQLAFIAGLSGLVYFLVFTLRFPLAQLYRTTPPVDYTKLTNYSASGFFAYVAGLVVLFGLYIWAIRLTAPAANPEGQRTGGPAISFRFIFIAGAILAVILIFSYPLTAIDLFIYAIRTRGWALYDLNPLATAPQTLPSTDPWLGLAAEWVDAPSPYGPLWEWLSLAAFYLSGGDFLRHLFALKIVAMLAYLGCAWLVYQILQRLQPGWAAAGTIAFAWNPLVLLESVQNGHNDIVMIFFVLAAMWVMAGGKFSLKSVLLGCFFLALSILVKFVTIIIVPFLLLAMTTQVTTWTKRLAVMLGYGLLISVLIVGPTLPLWPGWDNWAVLQAGSGAGRSLLALLVLGLKEVWGVNFAFDFSRNLLLGLFGLIYLYFLWQTVLNRYKSPPQILLNASCLVLFWYVLLAAPVFHAWYLLWFLPLAALLLPNRCPLRAAAVFSITALLIIPYFETVRVWYPALLDNQFLGHLLGVPLLLVPPALALLWPISPSAKSEV